MHTIKSRRRGNTMLLILLGVWGGAKTEAAKALALAEAARAAQAAQLPTRRLRAEAKIVAKIEAESAKTKIAEVIAEAADAKTRKFIATSEAAEYRRLLGEANKDDASLAAVQLDEGEVRGGGHVNDGGGGSTSRRNADEETGLSGGVVSRPMATAARARS